MQFSLFTVHHVPQHAGQCEGDLERLKHQPHIRPAGVHQIHYSINNDIAGMFFTVVMVTETMIHVFTKSPGMVTTWLFSSSSTLATNP